MELKDLIKKQIDLDIRHGFPVSFDSDMEAYAQLSKDLIGLIGEIGEFSNAIKKINIKLDRPNEYELDIHATKGQLGEELADTLIYIIRLAAILEVDLEQQLTEKMTRNEHRYANLQKQK
ncbi:MazG nucleotide pyrophosphohydrolase domain-containing protein [Halomonas sp. YLGW01]|uniref:MazG nucleotide pyrophosphohydrolase domain-containing protein n=1 Tax=Halomonas sp. YLGW01 TaxID=2773308 RepID=UPI001781558C|nr:MazG nucleotide pyrophosphohydrolase domain-containing protein [Halomonas sp. YLGW01]